MDITKNLKRILSVPVVRKRVLFTLAILVIYRLLANVPSPGVNTSALAAILSQNQIFGVVDVFTGGAFENFAIIALGLTPYIGVSFLISILTKVLPQLKSLQEEGERGKRIIIQLMRIGTLPVALIQAISIILFLKSQKGVLITSVENDIFSLGVLAVTIVAATILLMWLGENITESGLGQGVSLIIACNILSSIPHSIVATFQTGNSDFITVLTIAAVFLSIIVSGIFVTEATRRIPITYTRRLRAAFNNDDKSALNITVGSTVLNGVFLSLYFIDIPKGIGQLLSKSSVAQISSGANMVVNFFSNQNYIPFINFAVVFVCSYFFTFVYFNPKEIAENQQKQGGFIPGIRPGKQTADYIKTILKRVAFLGALSISVIVTIPTILQNITSIATLAIGGTGIIIVIGAILQIRSQVKSYVATQSYEKFTV